MASDALLDAVKSRRTYYALSSESPIPDKKIHELVNQAITHVPSSFNSQSTRVLVLLNEEHKKLWGDIVIPIIKTVAPPDAWPASEKRLNGFKNGYGTMLFYEDPKDVAKLQEQYPLYADKFPQWSEHTNAMHQYVCKYLLICLARMRHPAGGSVSPREGKTLPWKKLLLTNLQIVWTALEKEGFGANLQHYNPLIDDKIASNWNLPQNWSLKGQLVFGKPVGDPNPKTFKPLEERVFVHGAKE